MVPLDFISPCRPCQDLQTASKVRAMAAGRGFNLQKRTIHFLFRFSYSYSRGVPSHTCAVIRKSHVNMYIHIHTHTWSRRAPVFQCHVGLPMVKQPCKANSWWSWSRRLQAELACRPWYAWAPFKSCPLSWGYPNSWMVYNEQFCKKVMVWGVPRLEGHKNCKVAAAGSCFFSD